jgi:hypothetical protein
MNQIAEEEDLVEGEEKFTSPKKVGWLLRRLRFRRPEARNDRAKQWRVTSAEIDALANTYGMKRQGGGNGGQENGSPEEREPGVEEEEVPF